MGDIFFRFIMSRKPMTTSHRIFKKTKQQQLSLFSSPLVLRQVRLWFFIINFFFLYQREPTEKKKKNNKKKTRGRLRQAQSR